MLREKLKLLFREKPTYADIKTEKEKDDYYEIQKLKDKLEERGKNIKGVFYSLKKEHKSIEDIYKIPIEYIKSVARGFNRAFIFLGDAGLGKTYLTREILKKEKVNFIESRGVSSPLSLYYFIHENNSKNKVLVFDDVAQLINEERTFSILLGVLWDGVAQWNTTSEKLKIPPRFLFNGRIIIISNKLSGFNSDIVKSRCLVYELELKREEKIKIMYEIAKQSHKELTREERFKIVKFLKENSTEGTLNFDLRTQQKAEQLYLYSKTSNVDWKDLVLGLLRKNREVEILEYALKNSDSIKEALNYWKGETGQSRRKFFI